MRKSQVLVLSGCVALIVGCKENSSHELPDPIPIIVNELLYWATIDKPQAELSIENGEIREDILQLTASFLGGCEEHEFSLIAARGINKSNPPIALVLITHDAKHDACTDKVSKEILFDLSPFREHLQSSGLLKSGTILIPLQGLAEPLRYEFGP